MLKARHILLCTLYSVLCILTAQAVNPTKTLPIIYVNTQTHRSVNDTETQIPATVYIDSILPDYPSLGSKTAPLPATIKGRGNWTWSGFDKKPYKIKFDTKGDIRNCH